MTRDGKQCLVQMKMNKKAQHLKKINFVPKYPWPIGLIEIDVMISI